jgi:hypothetical protein
MLIPTNFSRRLVACAASGAVVAGSLASFAAQSAGGEESVQRSTADVRERPADELDRPRNKERWTHRGYEIKTDKFIVVATTRVEDSRWVAAQMETMWADFGRLADAWTKSHHQPDFGIDSVQVYIDGNKPKDRDLPRTTLSVVGIQTQINLYVGPGQPELEDQLYRLRKAAGQAFLHTAELDRQLPPWACDGLASYVAAERMNPDDIKAADQQDKAPGAPRLGGQQWRFKRGEQDRLSIPTFDQAAAAQEVEFLLTGNDAAYAPAFFAAMKESITDVNFRRTQGSLVTARRGEEQPADLGPVDNLASRLAKSFEKWQKSPLAGQPKLESEESSLAHRQPEPVLRAEREMAVVLKLARKFATTEKGTTHTRITAFDKDKGMTVLSRRAENKPAPLPELYQRMIATERPLWGTLNVDGQLVLSTQHDQLKEMLGLENNRYRWETGSDRSVLTTTVDNQWKLQGWLEENKEDPSRPLAKFTATKIATRR